MTKMTRIEPIGNVLNDILDKFRLRDTYHRSHIPDYWNEIVGSMVSAVSKTGKLENGILTVRVSSPVWRTELILRREELCSKLNEKIGVDMIREINIR